jgi:hypothetical protein
LHEREPEFSEAVKAGHILAEAWWTLQGKRGLFTSEGIKFHAVSFFNMTNRFRNEWQRAPTPRIDDPEDPRDKVQIYIPDNWRWQDSFIDSRCDYQWKDKYLKLFYSLVAAGALLATSVSAQTWPKPAESGKFSYRSVSQINSGAAPTAAPPRDASAALDVLVTSTNGTTGLTLLEYSDNGDQPGLLVSGASITATLTPQTVHMPAPQNFQWLKLLWRLPLR